MRSRRALSTVVGAVFAIIALTSTVTYVSYSMGILDNYNQSVLTKNQQLSDVNKEKFQISSVTVPNGKLNITVANTGSVPINFTKIWIQNTTTTAIDWVRSYVPTHNFVVPGGVLTNIGQNSGVNINPANSYNVKLVTSRGNTQQFMINSANSAPLNIQLLAFPTSIPSGLTTELVMIVVNNGSSTLTNVIPTQPAAIDGTADYVFTNSQSTPPKYNTLSPGSMAIFKWDLTLSGKKTEYRTFSVGLQNGYIGNTGSVTINIVPITAASSNWSTTWGIISINYTSLQWTQNGGTTWNSAWSLPNGKNTVWRVNMTNNDPDRTFILNGNSTLLGSSAATGSSTAWWIVPNSYPPQISYPSNSQTIAPGQTGRVYFGASGPGVATKQNSPGAGQYGVSILIYGYWDSATSSNFFGQNIPYEGIVVT